jgi:hypothetical protein
VFVFNPIQPGGVGGGGLAIICTPIFKLKNQLFLGFRQVSKLCSLNVLAPNFILENKSGHLDFGVKFGGPRKFLAKKARAE